MRKLTDHIVSPGSDRIEISVMGAPGPGGAHYHYIFDMDGTDSLGFYFQNGGIAEHGVNGVTQEALLAVVIDRLRSFQAGPFACRENAIALTKCEEALHWLHARTRDRMARGVEGRVVV